ncbi:MAG: STAS domain-containing protein [Thiobacillaceae bacterium]|nr:STAS domain-containing protein [Thiobacillaceae bacterium]MCX7671983.1 STAS domain-containing protein [Thiobacillaceae bacterium]MDW8322571.1 STAS domain-containing protein [Burkholderiales bacterium]
MRREADTVYLDGELTLANARRLLDEGAAAIAEGAARFDLAGVTKVDSAALSLMLAWRRRALAAGRDLTFSSPPESIKSLARLYGVDELLAI